MDSKKLKELIGHCGKALAAAPRSLESPRDATQAEVRANHIASVLSIQDLNIGAGNDLAESCRNQIGPPIMHEHPSRSPLDHELSSLGVNRAGTSNDAVLDEGVFEASNRRRNWPADGSANGAHRLRRRVVKRGYRAHCHGFVRDSDAVLEPDVVLICEVVTGVPSCGGLKQCQKTPGRTEPCIRSDARDRESQLRVANDLFTCIY
jgi:hypothetical protein